MFDLINKGSDAAIKLCAALLVVQVANKIGLFDPIKKLFRDEEDIIDVDAK